MSNYDRYDDLIREFCFMAGITNEGDMLRDGVLNVGGHLARIDYVEEIGQCRIMVDLGEPDWEHEADFYRFMLQSNFDNATEFFPSLSLQPETHHAILSYCISLDTLENDITLAKLLGERLCPLIDEWKMLFDEYLGAIKGEAERLSSEALHSRI